MKYFILLITFITCQLSIAQTDFNKNTFTIETGFFDRGLFGITYSRNFQKRPDRINSFGIGTGVGSDLDGFTWGIPNFATNISFYAKAESLMGPGPSKLAIGIQPKVVLREHVTSIFHKSSFSTTTYLGFTHIRPKGFIFQIRLGVTPYFRLSDFTYDALLPAFGISIGKAF